MVPSVLQFKPAFNRNVDRYC
uniref:Uncharacterized protein n=1 Tax=Anguilla anguilla TaxID=7936 RepID=A0A0E9V263_ANGAN